MATDAFVITESLNQIEFMKDQILGFYNSKQATKSSRLSTPISNKMTIRELANIIKKYTEQQQSQEIQLVTADEDRAKELLRDLIEVNNRAYNRRKEEWFEKNQTKRYLSLHMKRK